jgi:ABC-type amino acid transport substrate-binding protein
LCLCLLFALGCGKSHRSETYTIGIDPYFYPLNLKGQDKNVLGFSTELLQEIGKKKKIQLATRRMNFNDLVEGLNKKQVDAILSSMQPHLFLENTYSFSDVYLHTGPVLVVRANSKFDALEELTGKEVAVESGSTSILVVEKVPGIIVRPYDSNAKALDDLAAGTIDGVVMDVLTAHGFVNDLFKERLKISTHPLNPEGIRLVTRFKAQESLVEDFNEALEELMDDGIYDDLLKKWNLP